MSFHCAKSTRVASRASFLIALACLLAVCLPLAASAKSRKDKKAKSEPEFVAREAKPDSTGDRTLTRALDLKVRRIVIDPGHGGFDNGTVGITGLQEKELVLDVAQRLGKILQRRMGADVIYTRDTDKFIPLETRTEIANHEDADLFISIHGNHSDDPQTRGIETYYLSFTAATDALEVASRENAASEMSVGKLQDLVKQIAMNEKVGESREFAANVQRALWAGLGAADPAIRDRGVKKAPFIVLIGAHMPSILAEISFLSNSTDEQKLKEAQYREQIAESLYRGIAKYVGGLSGVRTPGAVASTAPVGIHLPPLAPPPAAVAPAPVPAAPVASNSVPPTLTTARPPFSGAGPPVVSPAPVPAAPVASNSVPPTLTTVRPPFSGAGPPVVSPAPVPAASVVSSFVPPTLTTVRPPFSGAGPVAVNGAPPGLTVPPSPGTSPATAVKSAPLANVAPADTIPAERAAKAASSATSAALQVPPTPKPEASADSTTASKASSTAKISSKPVAPAVSIDWNTLFLGFILHRRTLVVMALLLAAAWSIAHDYNEPARRFARRHFAASAGDD